MYSEDRLKEFLEEYNTNDWTDKGRRDLIRQYIFFAFMKGFTEGIQSGEEKK